MKTQICAVLVFLTFASSFACASSESSWFEAARRGNLVQLKKLSRKIKVDQTNSAGESALILASESGSKSVVDFLLEKRANVNLKDSAGNTAIFYAIDTAADDISLLLIQAGAKLDDRNKDGDNLLAVAGKAGRVKVVEDIVKRDSSLLNQVNNLGETPVMSALRGSHFALATEMISLGAKKDIKNRKGQGLLEVAREAGVPEGHSFYKTLGH